MNNSKYEQLRFGPSLLTSLESGFEGAECALHVAEASEGSGRT